MFYSYHYGSWFRIVNCWLLLWSLSPPFVARAPQSSKSECSLLGWCSQPVIIPESWMLRDSSVLSGNGLNIPAIWPLHPCIAILFCANYLLSYLRGFFYRVEVSVYKTRAFEKKLFWLFKNCDILTPGELQSPVPRHPGASSPANKQTVALSLPSTLSSLFQISGILTNSKKWDCLNISTKIVGKEWFFQHENPQN